MFSSSLSLLIRSVEWLCPQFQLSLEDGKDLIAVISVCVAVTKSEGKNEDSASKLWNMMC